MTADDSYAITDATTIVASPDQTSAGMPGETVILHPKSGRYFGLDDVGTRVWELLQVPRTFGEVRDAILAEYAVDADRCERDLRNLVQQLRNKGLVDVVDGAGF